MPSQEFHKRNKMFMLWRRHSRQVTSIRGHSPVTRARCERNWVKWAVSMCDQWTSIPACHDGSDDATCSLFRPVTRADLSLVSTPRLPHRHNWQLLPEYHGTGHADMTGSDKEGFFASPSLHPFTVMAPGLHYWQCGDHLHYWQCGDHSEADTPSQCVVTWSVITVWHMDNDWWLPFHYYKDKIKA